MYLVRRNNFHSPRVPLELSQSLISHFNLIFTTYSHEFFPDQNKHYESLVFTVWLSEGEPEITEPDKCKEWKFFGIDDLPPNIFEPAKQTIEKFREPILTAMEEECKVGPMLRWAREQNAPR